MWLVWDFDADDGRSDIWLTSSKDGTTWSSPTMIHDQGTDEDFWGPFSLIWNRGPFLIVARRRSLSNWNWRIVVSSSRDGVSWTPFTHITNPNPSADYWEKGPTIFAIDTADGDYKYAVVFKKSLPGETEWQLRQVFLNLNP